ncbi:Uncharacterized protein OBRU01_12542 [Operophtera brumata]|uniref:Uncharacterized protein n=1 Tax=Operophtera brumata TaxID=104452 RepID=A0A0L7LAN4_OPEBR|nr:Uncharacterized protein OBRU01_12542 [Operophtera brumata]
MDASASKTVNENKDVFNFILDIESSEFPTHVKQKSTIIKYTKLPEFDIGLNVKWPHQSYSMQPRLRRITTVDDPISNTSRSLKPELVVLSKSMATNISKRKIVTINEDDSKDTKPSAKKSNVGVKALKPNSNYRSKPSNLEDNHTVASSKSVNVSKNRVSKNYISPSEREKEVYVIKSKLNENLKRTIPNKPIEKANLNKSSTRQTKSKQLKEVLNNHKPLNVKNVPVDEKHRRSVFVTPGTNATAQLSCEVVKHKDKDASTDPFSEKVDSVTEMDSCVPQISCELVIHKDASTDPLPEKVDSVTEMDSCVPQIIYKCVHSTDVQTELIKEVYDSLEIPNVTLINGESHRLHSKSLPNLQVPAFKVTLEDETADVNYSKNMSYIISRATLTYTTKQKFDVHVLGSNDDAYSYQSPSPMSYPHNVVSVYKKEIQCADYSNEIAVSNEDSKTSKRYKNRINDIKSRDCFYTDNGDKLTKPSDIISTIRVNDGLLWSEYICEQFQRELNFIDSFFESLQFLESCSLSDKCFKDDKIDALVKNPELMESEFDMKNLEYDSFFTKMENGANVDVSETKASNNLLLLNILIRDEQRRAKNLLFVLKKREDALKDFTKSQILYLENKKKQENTDISALKKKQRGALLKLQHECGEMQRMRKALLTLSEKRKLTLMKTKKDLELKLKNNVDMDRIILGKKKLKSNTTVDRSSPLKCFDLSTSGCEESSTSRRHSVETLQSPEHVCIKHVSSAEKSIQTGDSIIGPTSATKDRSTENAAAENFIIVDGGYLNIVFRNLSLPSIFSGGKQYEVNEQALRNIVDSSNLQHHRKGTEALDILMDQIRSSDSDRSSSPSTARSLVEELDQYYKGLNDRDKSPVDKDYSSSSTVCKSSDALDQVEPMVAQSRSFQCTSTINVDSNKTIFNGEDIIESFCVCEENEKDLDSKAVPVVIPTGPLPVPAGSSEIKELEQQQCRLLVVREIPDKPPPPYTPPADARASKPPRRFHCDDVTEDKIHMYMAEENVEPLEPSNDFDVFVHDFCNEMLDRRKQDSSEEPWSSFNVLASQQPLDPRELGSAAAAELSDVLSGAKPTFGRHMEPEWTAIQHDEDVIKNQIFESIFQRILNTTIEKYKQTVLYEPVND